MKTKALITLTALSFILTSMSCSEWAKYARNSTLKVNPDPIFIVDGYISFELTLGIPTSDYKKVDSIDYHLTYVSSGKEFELEKIRVLQEDIDYSIKKYKRHFDINQKMEEVIDTTFLQLQTDIYKNGRLIKSPQLPFALIINKNER